MGAPHALRNGALLLAIAAAGWLAARSAGRRTGSELSTTPAPGPAVSAASDSVFMVVNRPLTAAARAKLDERAGDTAEILVLLDSADIRTCEDLGRQLRELRSRTGPFFVVADSETLVVVRTFARRERLHAAGFVAINSRGVMAGGARLPTPAVLIVRERSVVVGVAHPRRFPNVRVRSFADELSAYLPATRGSANSPGTRRLQ